MILQFTSLIILNQSLYLTCTLFILGPTLACLLLILSLAFFIPDVWLPYRATGKVLHFPTLIVCGFCAIAGILSFYSGLILDAIQRKEHREFEFRLQEVHNVKSKR